MNDKELVNPPTGTITVRQDGTSNEMTMGGELAALESAEAARAKIEAQVAVAQRFPRKYNVAREQILMAAQDPELARIALYNRPVGRERNPRTGQWEDKHAIDLSIVFMQVVIAAWMHMRVSHSILYEDPYKLRMNVAVWDMQSNVSYDSDALIEKTVERRDARGRDVVSQRLTSRQEMVYLVAATADEVRSRMGAERSKLIRDHAKRLVPRHLLDEARRIIDETNRTEDAKNPEAAKDRVFDAFAGIGITREMLTRYVDGPIDARNTELLAELRGLYQALKDNQTTWKEVMAIKDAPAEGAEQPAKQKKLKDKLTEEGKTDEPGT